MSELTKSHLNILYDVPVCLITAPVSTPMRATNGGWCWFCYGAPGEQVEHILWPVCMWSKGMGHLQFIYGIISGSGVVGGRLFSTRLNVVFE